MSLWSNTDANASVPKFIDRGQVLGVTVTAGGTGYTNGAAATFDAAPGGGITATGTIVVTGGVITGINITNPGAGYTTAPGITVAGGSSAQFSVKIAPIVYSHTNIFFVDETEAQQDANKNKGIHGPGWWHIVESKNSFGDTRYKVENLVAMAIPVGTSGDSLTDDTTVPDVNAVAAISVQPTNQTTVAGAATFSVTAAITPSGTPTYQWQRATAALPTIFTDVVGATSASLALTGRTLANNGDLYRVIVGGAGAVKVTSNVATLTFGT